MIRTYKFTGVMAALAVAALLLLPQSAEAMPAFARQTGLECISCHVGGFGPQLTDFGRKFKLMGYTLGENITNPAEHLSGMIFGGYNHVNKDMRRGTELPDSAGSATQSNVRQGRFAANDNWTLDQAAIFYGGTVYGKLGMLAQATYNGVNKNFAWDNTDIRLADTFEIGGTDLLLGATVNNNPTVQDAWQTTPAWGFPYVKAGLGSLSPATSPLLLGAQGQKVVGEGIYGLWDDLIYAEFSNYSGLSRAPQAALGQIGADSAARLGAFNPYWRLALQHTFDEHYVELGTFGMVARQSPGTTAQPGSGNTSLPFGMALRQYGTDKLTDYALDATYQGTFAGGDHIVSLYGFILQERQYWGATNNAQANTDIGLTNSQNPRDKLTTFRATGSYYFQNDYGITVSRTVTVGNQDTGLYTTRVAKPNSAYWTVQLDYTPFGHEDTWGYPYNNIRLFAQYTAYDKFNGAKDNYDNSGRNAGDNNLLYTGLWFAF